MAAGTGTAENSSRYAKFGPRTPGIANLLPDRSSDLSV